MRSCSSCFSSSFIFFSLASSASRTRFCSSDSRRTTTGMKVGFLTSALASGTAGLPVPEAGVVAPAGLTARAAASRSNADPSGREILMALVGRRGVNEDAPAERCGDCGVWPDMWGVNGDDEGWNDNGRDGVDGAAGEAGFAMGEAECIWPAMLCGRLGGVGDGLGPPLLGRPAL